MRALTGRTMEIVQFDDLVERSVGAAANLSAEEIEQVIARDPRREPLRPGWRRDLTGRLPFIGAESMVESGERVARHLEVRTSELADAGETDVLKIVVGHGGSFRLCAVVLGLMDLATANERSMHHVTPVYLERTGAGQWRHAAGAWKERNVTVPGDADG